MFLAPVFRTFSGFFFRCPGDGAWRSGLLVLLLVGWLGGCSSKPKSPAPVEDRKPVRGAKAESSSAKAAINAENAGKPGYYTVKAGDTLYRIGLEYGQAWRDLARWNNLEAPYTIEVGQILSVAPPNSAASDTAVSITPVPNPKSNPALGGDDVPSFGWPVAGPVLAGFDENKNKGLDLGGKAGDPVLAAAEGRVVYAGEGLRGYGKLIIIKHNSTYLSAYAHNQSLLIKEDQQVKKGQKIAEMGSTDADRTKLHFEIRRQGKPVDPAKYLAAR